METQIYSTYLADIQKNLSTGDATEHTHRLALQELLKSAGDNVTVINEPRRIACGAPDLRVQRGAAPVGYIEAKDVGTPLQKAGRSEQLRRYKASLPNLILTDYLEFWRYVDGDRRETARLAEVQEDGEIREVEGGVQAVLELLDGFFAAEPPIISRPRDLAERMAGLARLTRRLIEETFQYEPEKGSLHGQYHAFLEVLIPDLTYQQFADMYAQTIAYGLFAARCNFEGETFTREHAAHDLPKTNPFLRKLFVEIAGPDLDDRIAWAVDDQAHLLDKTDIAAILKDFGKHTERRDPVVHFYETFLAKYDPKMRKARGVYYTPEPVVGYIVRSIDHLLKTRLNRPKGLADENTLILDPACGTGTFLFAVIDLIRESFAGNEGMWNGYVREHLLNRIFGFELLMAPYAVAHMKLGIQLRESGYKFEGDERLRIYLTNALERGVKKKEAMFAQWIADEADAAAHIKQDDPILVVLGNPPYSGHSANRSEYVVKYIPPGQTYLATTERGFVERRAGRNGKNIIEKTFIGRLIEDYKQVDGMPLGEKNPKMLQDDYVKFIRFAQWRIQRTGEGVIGYITNHGYLDNPTFRGMRQSLIETFNKIYVYNLHGNSRRNEKTPEGGKDENVFDIQQGVAILLCVKEKGNTETTRVYHADLWGSREAKYRSLTETDTSETQWLELEPSLPFYLFVPQNTELLGEYEQGWRMPEVFPVNSTGIKTHRDHFAVDFDEMNLRKRISVFRGAELSDEVVSQRFKLRDTRDWKLSEARARLRMKGNWEVDFHICLYRPFDTRSIYYSDEAIELPRREVMRHMLAGQNMALSTTRNVEIGHFGHVLCTRSAMDHHAVSLKETNYLFPLYLYPDDDELAFDTGCRPNLNPAFLKIMAERLGLQQSVPHDLPDNITPENLFHYAYAVFHSPTYRKRYAEFLKIDFPRLPLTSDIDLFRKLAEVGEELVVLHLMESPLLDSLITHYPVSGSDVVEKVRYVEQDQRVYINSDQYFEGVPPEVWEFCIGGYQVCEKWLKDRRTPKYEKLTYDDQIHYQRVVVALKETIQRMEEIDRIIPSWPIQ